LISNPRKKMKEEERKKVDTFFGCRYIVMESVDWIGKANDL
jgi:hypothetical protein